MKKLIPTIGAVTGLLIGMPCLNAGGPDLKIERSVKVSFDSKVGKTYNAYSTTDVTKKKWELLGGEDGTGEKIVFFYQSDDDQKVFFKVDEASGSGGGDDSGGVDHEWLGTSLRLKNANGQWGGWVDLRGQKGSQGDGLTEQDLKTLLNVVPKNVPLFEVFSDNVIEDIESDPQGRSYRFVLFGMNNGSDFLFKLTVDAKNIKKAKIKYDSGAVFEGSFEFEKSTINNQNSISIPFSVFKYKYNGQNVSVYIYFMPNDKNAKEHWTGPASSRWYIDGQFIKEDRHIFTAAPLIE